MPDWNVLHSLLQVPVPLSPGSDSVLGADSAEPNFLHQRTPRGAGAAAAEGGTLLRAEQQPLLELPTKCL